MTEYPITPNAKAVTGSKKRKFHFSSVVVKKRSTSSYWSGGSRNYYSIFNFKTGGWRGCPTGEYPSFEAHITLDDGELLIQTGLFNGKESVPHIICLASDEDDARKYLGIS